MERSNRVSRNDGPLFELPIRLMISAFAGRGFYKQVYAFVNLSPPEFLLLKGYLG